MTLSLFGSPRHLHERRRLHVFYSCFCAFQEKKKKNNSMCSQASGRRSPVKRVEPATVFVESPNRRRTFPLAPGSTSRSILPVFGTAWLRSLQVHFRSVSENTALSWQVRQHPLHTARYSRSPSQAGQRQLSLPIISS